MNESYDEMGSLLGNLAWKSTVSSSNTKEDDWGALSLQHLTVMILRKKDVQGGLPS